VFAALFDIQLYGLLKLDKHRPYDVWKGEVTYAETEEQVAQDVPRPQSSVLVPQRETTLSRCWDTPEAERKYKRFIAALLENPWCLAIIDVAIFA